MILTITEPNARLHAGNHVFVIQWQDYEREVEIKKVKVIIIPIDATVEVSAIEKAVKRGIKIGFIDENGKTFGNLWSSKYDEQSELKAKQAEFIKSKWALEWSKMALNHVIDMQCELLVKIAKKYPKYEPLLNIAIIKTWQFKPLIKNLTDGNTEEKKSELRKIEKNACHYYFNALNRIVPKKYQIHDIKKIPTFDKINALQIFAGQVLAIFIKSYMLDEGLDPELGIFHKMVNGKFLLSYDISLICRVWSEELIAVCLYNEILDPDDLTYRNGKIVIGTKTKDEVLLWLERYLVMKDEFEGEMIPRELHVERQVKYFADIIRKYPDLQEEDIRILK